jgi:hypothetical protein
MTTHTVGHDKDVPTRLEPGRIHGGLSSASVLIVAPLNAHIGQSGETDRLECRHHTVLNKE